MIPNAKQKTDADEKSAYHAFPLFIGFIKTSQAKITSETYANVPPNPRNNAVRSLHATPWVAVTSVIKRKKLIHIPNKNIELIRVPDIVDFVFLYKSRRVLELVNAIIISIMIIGRLIEGMR